MTDAHNIFPPSSVEEILALVGSLPKPKYDLYVSDVRKNGFEASQERCNRLAHGLDLSSDTVAVALGITSFLYVRTMSLSKSKRNNALKKLAEDIRGKYPESVPGHSELFQRISNLVEPTKEIDTARKVSRLKTGFVKNAIGFASFVDLRPNFDVENEAVQGLLPVIQFRITTDADASNERHLLFQIDEPRLKALREAVEAAEKKLRILLKSKISNVRFHSVEDK